MTASRSRASARTSSCRARDVLGRERRGRGGRAGPWGGSWQGLQEKGEVEGGGGVRERTDRHEVYPGLRDRPGPSPGRCRRWPRAPRGRPRGPRSRAAARGLMLSSSSRGAPAASASSTSARRCGTRPRAARPAPPRARARTAAPTPPAIAAWFSLMRIASKSPTRWFVPPPAATAAFSSRRSPGRRLARVEDARAGAARPPRRSARSVVATPLRRCRRFSAVRSAREQRGGRRPRRRAPGRPRATRPPRRARVEARRRGRARAKTRSAASRPKSDAGLLLGDARPRPRAGRHGRPRRQVAGADVLVQRAADERARAP